MRIGLVQLNPVVGDIIGNTERLQTAIAQFDAEIILTPEMSICGYPPRDLLCNKDFVRACEQAVLQIACTCPDKLVVLGHPRIDASTGRVRNSASVIYGGEIIEVSDKQLLPSYDVFDEKRYFETGQKISTFTIDETKIGIAICEDFWQGNDADVAPTYDINPVQELVEEGCKIILSPSASPFVTSKHSSHLQYALQVAQENNVIIAMCNQVGGNDDLVFDGGSFVVSSNGLLGELPLFDTGSVTVDLNTVPVEPTLLPSEQEQWKALVLGTKDYVQKTGHSKVILGISGGIDSALVATIAVAALGADSVQGVLMPSRYSSRGSIEDAERLASNLGVCTDTLPIEHLHAAFERTFSDGCINPTSLTEENAQARIRGLLLMALTNSNGSLLLATGNKSELAVGYSTLYGDMNGAISVIGDVYKTDVWALSNWVNQNYEICGFSSAPIPENSISKPPSAELRPDQCDQDSLPEYDELDSVLRLHIDHELGIEDIKDALPVSSERITKIVRMVDIAQFKREQASVIFKISPRTFGRGRRMPIVMKRSWVNVRETL
tara:strand:+ start:1890 stop:3545 length:1656 start_codon:yes stop_codon:yes gene_type:complete